MKRFFHLIYFLVNFTILWASTSSQLKFLQIGLDQGLSHSTINGITQDTDGFLWVCTTDGINRFDGYGFTVFLADSIDNEVMDIITDPNGEIFASTQNAIYRFSHNDDKFIKCDISVPVRINKLFNYKDNLYAITSRGILEHDSVNHFSRKENLLPDLSIDAVYANDDKLYLASDYKGIFLVENDKPHLLPGTEHYQFNAIYAGKDELFLATEGDGLILYKPSTGNMKSFKDVIPSSYIRSLLIDANNRVWIGSYTGLFILDNNRNSFTSYVNTPEEGSISHSSVRKIFLDKQGGIWLGTFFGGLNYYHPIKNQFTNIRKNADPKSLDDNVIGPIAQRSNGEIWFGTNNGGINILNPTDGRFSHISVKDGLKSNDIKAIYFDEKTNKAFIGSNNGSLVIIDTEKGKIVDWDENINSVYDIIPALDSKNLWMASVEGLFLYDPKEKKILGTFSVNDRKRSRVLMRSKDNRLWVASEFGLEVFLEKDGTLQSDKTFPTLKTNVSHIFQSNFNNDIWIASSNGLYRYSPEASKMKKYGIENGLPGNLVYALSEDANGNMWVSTNHGLASINPKTEIVNNFTSKDGIQGEQFNPKSALMADNGRMYFGGVNGITYFNPSTFEKNLFSPVPYLDNLKLYNKIVKPGDETKLLQADINDTKRVTFNSDQTSFSIDFGVVNFTSLTHNTFKYKLEGMDKQWTTVPDGVRSVVYSNLPPGKYTFRLQSANNDGVWSDEEKTLEIVILAPWYKRWWALLIFFSVTIVTAFFLTRYFWIRSDRRKKEKNLRELDEMKLKFFVNMSHELRTPLTLMMLPINDLMEKGADSSTMKKYSLIKSNTQRIKNIVDQILEYQKAETGILKLKVKPTDINNLIQGILEPYRVYAEKKNLPIQFNSEIEESSVLIDPNYIEHIVGNLLANALKYTPADGMVRVDVSDSKDSIIIKITDLGIGIPKEKLQMIFNPFYQVNYQAEGYGIGLALVKRLVDNHHGKISVESEPGKGTSFTVTLPRLASSYSTQEMALTGSAQTASGSIIENLIPEIEEEVESEKKEMEPGRKTIMIVDDNPEILKYLSESFSSDFNVLTAINGAKAIEALSGDNIHLVITDVMMPDIDGIHLCRAIKRNLRTSHIPVIMLSGKSEIVDKLEGLNVGADDYIGKPFSMKELLRKVKNILRTRDSLISRYINSKTQVDPVKLTQSPLDEQFLKKAIEVMEKNLDNADFTTDEFASEMCMSRSNLHLKMKAITGEATNDFIRRTRLTNAAELLKTQNYTVAEVSYMVGYKTPSYFATAFKAFFGYSPSTLINS